MQYPIAVKIANGVQVPVAKSTTARHSTAVANLGIVNPAVHNMAEVTDENIQDLFYMAAANNNSTMYVGADGKAKYFNKPTPEGYKALQFGFDVFELGGVMYGAFATPKANWGCDFSISEQETGKVIYTSNFSKEGNYDGGASGNGNTIVARKVDDYTVELYRIYTSATAGKFFTAMYEITIPRPAAPAIPEELYIHYRHQGEWGFGDAIALERRGDKFEHDGTEIGIFIENGKPEWYNVDIVFTTGAVVDGRSVYNAAQSFEAMLGAEHYVYHPSVDGSTTLTRSTTAEYDSYEVAPVHSMASAGKYAVSVDFADPEAPVLTIGDNQLTGIENVEAVVAEARYYDIYGRAIDANNAHGVVIRVQGNKAAKVLK